MLGWALAEDAARRDNESRRVGRFEDWRKWQKRKVGDKEIGNKYMFRCFAVRLWGLRARGRVSKVGASQRMLCVLVTKRLKFVCPHARGNTLKKLRGKNRRTLTGRSLSGGLPFAD